MSYREVVSHIVNRLRKKESQNKIKKGTADFVYNDLTHEKSLHHEQLKAELKTAEKVNDVIKTWVAFYSSYYMQQLFKFK